MASIYGTFWSDGQYLEQSGRVASIYGTGWSGGQYLGQAGQVASIYGIGWSGGQYLGGDGPPAGAQIGDGQDPAGEGGESLPRLQVRGRRSPDRLHQGNHSLIREITTKKCKDLKKFVRKA
jgi:hypothetical protein